MRSSAAAFVILRRLAMVVQILSWWKKGKIWFIDPEEKYILRLFNTVSGNLYINTDHVNPTEIRSMKDLLNPKWKGKVAVLDPRGGNRPALYYSYFGEEFIKKFYIHQKPAVTRNRRQITDWLARGTYPISPDAGSGDVKRLKEEGFPLKIIYSLSDLPSSVSAGNGLVALLNKAPHPNAARVFLNWVASREGLEVLSQSYLYPTTRTDDTLVLQAGVGASQRDARSPLINRLIFGSSFTINSQL